MGIHDCCINFISSIKPVSCIEISYGEGGVIQKNLFTLASIERRVVDLFHDSVVLAEKDEDPFFASIFLC